MSDDPILDLFSLWHRDFEQGRDASTEELCRDCPELAVELRRQIDAFHAVNRLLQSGGDQGVRDLAFSARPRDRTEDGPPKHPSHDETTPVAVPPPSSPRAPLPTIPGYTVLEKIGEGGMGVVYKARQIALGRVVALKMIRAGVQADPEDEARFLREAEIVAGLRHPHVVQIHDYGTHEGMPYFTLEYLEGGSLADRGGRPLLSDEAADKVKILAAAVHYAHEQGIVHRDLKPGNVLLDAEGTPKVSDFGLARRTGSDLTQSGALLGTPSYMPPEQTSGKSDAVGPPADVYALGAILYELLTGGPPFRGPSPLETLQLLLTTDPVPVRHLQPGVPRDLETICLKCLNKEPARRYGSAQALEEDLRRFLNGETIRARPVGRIERTWRWSRRRPAIAGLLALLAVTMVAGTAVSVIFGFHAEQQRAAAEQAGREADLARDEEKAARQGAIRQLIDVFTDKGIEAAGKLDSNTATLLFAKAVSLSAEEPPRERLNRIRVTAWSKDAGRPVRLLTVPGYRGAQDRYRVFEFHPSGRALLVVTASGTAVVWDLPGQSVRLEARATAGAWSPDGETLALAHGRGDVVLYGADDLAELARFSVGKVVRTLAFGRDSRHLAWAAGREVGAWDCVETSPVGPVRRLPATVLDLGFNDRGNLISTSCQDGKARVYTFPGDEGERAPLFRPVPHRSTGNGQAHTRDRAPMFLPGDQGLVTVSAENTPIWRNVRTGQPMHTITPPFVGHCVTGMAVSPDGIFLIITWANFGRVWDITTQKEVVDFNHDHSHSEGVAFDPARPIFVTFGDNAVARFWQAQTEPNQRIVIDVGSPLRHPAPVVLVRFAPVGPILAAALSDGRIIIWEAPKRLKHIHFQQPLYHRSTDGFSRVAASPDRRHFLLAGSTFTNSSLAYSRVHQMADGLPAGPRLGTGGVVLDGLFSGDGTRAILACSSSPWQSGRIQSMLLPQGRAGNVQFWDWKTGRMLGEPVPMPSEPRGLALRPDGKQLAVVCTNGPVVLLDPGTGRVLCQLDSGVRTAGSNPYEWWANGLGRYSPTGSRLATWELGKSVEVWDPNERKLLRHLPHAAGVREAGFDRTGRLLVTAGRDRAVRVWDVESGKEVGPALLHPQAAVRARFLDDVNEVLTTSDDGIVRRWHFRSGRLLSSFPSDQVWAQDLAFVPGEEWVVSGSLGGVTVFDRKSGRPLTPTLAGSYNAQTVSMERSAGNDRIVSGGLAWDVRGFDLASILRPSPGGAESLLRRAELSAGARIDEAGRITPLTVNEWGERWRESTGEEFPAWPGDWRPGATGMRAGVLLADELDGVAEPSVGQLARPGPSNPQSVGPGVELRTNTEIVYEMGRFPEVDYTLSFWLERGAASDARRTLLTCSENWRDPMVGDPLRLEIDGEYLVTRSSTSWVSRVVGRVHLPQDRWSHVAVVKAGPMLVLCLDGRPRAWASMPQALIVDTRHLRLQWKTDQPVDQTSGSSVRVADLRLEDRVWSPAELRNRVQADRPRPKK